MSKRMILCLTLGLLAAPSAARGADLITHVVSAECHGAVLAPGRGTCIQTFTFDEPGAPSVIDTHGNFHAIFAQQGGVTLTWIDSVGRTIFVSHCTGLGVSIGGNGPLDAQSETCTGSVREAYYYSGTQTLKVEAETDGCVSQDAACIFHGKLALSAPGSLL